MSKLSRISTLDLRRTPSIENRVAPQLSRVSSTGSTSGTSGTGNSTAVSRPRRRFLGLFGRKRPVVTVNDSRARAARERNETRLRELRARQAATAQQRARANALKNIVNSMNSGFTGRPRAELSANRRAAARTRWAKVRNDVKSKKLQLLDSVSSLYDSLEKAAQFKRTTLCRMVQGIAGPAIASLIDNATKSAQFSAKLLTMTAVVCQAGLAAGLTAKAVAMGLLYGHKLACSRSTKYSDVSSAIRNKVMPAVRGPMRLVWAAAASVTTSQNVIHFSWRWYLKDWLQNTVSKQNERLAGLVDFDAVNTVLNRHVHTMYGFMMGRDVNLKPLVMDMAATLNACVVEALFDHYAGPLFMPRPEPSASCRR